MARKVKITKVVTTESAAGTTRLFHGTSDIHVESFTECGVDQAKAIQFGSRSGCFWTTTTLWKAEEYARITEIAAGGKAVILSLSAPDEDLQHLQAKGCLQIEFDGFMNPLFRFLRTAQTHLNNVSQDMEITILE